VLWSKQLAHGGFRLLDAVVVKERRLLEGMNVPLKRVHSGWSVASSVTHDIRSASSQQTVDNVCSHRVRRSAAPKNPLRFRVLPKWKKAMDGFLHRQL